jgi:hypothetical protein
MMLAFCWFLNGRTHLDFLEIERVLSAGRQLLAWLLVICQIELSERLAKGKLACL